MTARMRRFLEERAVIDRAYSRFFHEFSDTLKPNG